MKGLSYEDFVIACEKIAHRIKKLNINSIYGIARGGQVVAVYVSHMSGIPVFDNINELTSQTIIIDDIADSGNTLLSYKKNNFKIATIYYHKQSKVEPDIWIYEKKEDWIKFPWETKETTVGDYASRM